MQQDSFKVTSGRDGSRQFNQHDVRDEDFGNYSYNRGGSWSSWRGTGRKSQGYRGGNRRSSGGYRGGARGGYKKDKGVNPLSRLDDDEDVDMVGTGGPETSRQRYNPYSKGGRRGTSSNRGRINDSVTKRLGMPFRDTRGGRRGGRGSRSGGNYNSGPNAWYRIVIPYGRKADKDFILKNITKLSDLPFVPHQFHFENNNAVFLVQDTRVAQAIRSVNKRITMPNGFKMIITMQETSPPNPPLDDDTVEKLKLCMSNRYDPQTKSLNLSSLATDEELSKEKIFLPLSRVTVFDKVVAIVEEFIPEVESIDLSENKLYNLLSASKLSKMKNLKKLNLSKNVLRTERELDKIKELKLDDLTLDGNPMCDEFKERSAYISAVRSRFPKVLKLDGLDLPPPIKFDIPTSTELPKTLGSHFPNDEVKNLLIQFMEQYYQLYDSDDRQGLLEAYHDQAMFSLNASYHSLDSKDSSRRSTVLNDYMPESRNLLKITDGARRQKSLRIGKLNVVALMCQLPKTQHDPNTINVDVSVVTSTMMVFTITGVFKETENPDRIRAFSRTFVTVPQGSGIVIINEQLSIFNASIGLKKKSFQTNTAPTPSPSPQPSPTVVSSQTTDQQAEMVRSFSQQSGMNADFSMKCLMQNDWDYEKSAKVFSDLHSKGAIPPEAFVK
ncbi:nuclear RNA export factor 1-like isoform X2 [Tubulanus polymorphus]|uniref:nuclear RNA export factor 1-like isoform X2 n=1 Tax=Tubulanus polymorphus TaxID=672921 RepID=UPI003DA421EC